MPKDSFILYTEHGQIIQKLDDAQAGRLLKGIMTYEIEGELPELDDITDIVFTTIRIRLDRDGKAYEEKCAKNRRNGGNGGRPPKPKNPNKPNGYSKNPNKPNGYSETWKKENGSQNNRTQGDTDTGTDTDTDTGTDTSLKKRRESFIPPTLKEVEVYAKEIGSTVDPGHFFDYYSAIGWTVGSTRIVDWKAKFRNWSNGGRNRSTGNVGPNGVDLLPESEQLHDLDEYFK